YSRKDSSRAFQTTITKDIPRQTLSPCPTALGDAHPNPDHPPDQGLSWPQRVGKMYQQQRGKGEGRHFLVGRHLMAMAVDTATTAPSIPKQTSRTRAATSLYACRIRTPPSWQ